MIRPVLTVRDRHGTATAQRIEVVAEPWLEGNAAQPVPTQLAFQTTMPLRARGAWIDAAVETPAGLVRLGSYVITRVAPARQAGWWQVTAQDSLAEVARVDAPGPVSPTPGQSLADFVRYLLHPVPIDYQGPHVTLPRGLVVERDRIGSARKLLAEHGLVATLRAGRLQVTPAGTLVGRVHTLPAGSAVPPPYGTSLETPNSVVVTGNRHGAEGGPEGAFRVVAGTRDGELAPHRYGTTRLHLDAPTLTSPGAAREYGLRELATRQAALEAVRVDAEPIPGIQLGDRIHAPRTMGPPLVGTVTGFSLPLWSGPRMTLNLQP